MASGPGASVFVIEGAPGRFAPAAGMGADEQAQAPTDADIQTHVQTLFVVLVQRPAAEANPGASAVILT